MKIAAAAYPIDWHNRWNDYVGKLRVWVRNAAERGAELIVFPEYGALELASLAGENNASDLAKIIDAVTARIKDVDDLHGSLAREFKLHICASSAPMRRSDEAGAGTVNRAAIFAPDGTHGTQEKIVLTPFERRHFGLVPGETLRVFDTSLGRIGILIGYDAEFPLLARAMVKAGAEVLLIPSSSDSVQGWHRVRIGARARALEGQCVVVHAVTVETADWLATSRQNRGTAGIFAPPAGELPEDGVIATGKADSSGWVHGEVDFDALRRVRADGSVRNVEDWRVQEAPGASVEMVSLGTPSMA